MKILTTRMPARETLSPLSYIMRISVAFVIKVRSAVWIAAVEIIWSRSAHCNFQQTGGESIQGYGQSNDVVGCAEVSSVFSDAVVDKDDGEWQKKCHRQQPYSRNIVRCWWILV